MTTRQFSGFKDDNFEPEVRPLIEEIFAVDSEVKTRDSESSGNDEIKEIKSDVIAREITKTLEMRLVQEDG